MNPFRISCTTCRAKLKITDPAAIGQILACPKCGSLVEAAPPANWSPDGPALADSTVFAISTPLAAQTGTRGAKAKVAKKAAASVVAGSPPPLPSETPALAPPPLPSPLLSTSLPLSPLAAGGTPIDLTSPAEAPARWFWPALSAATLLSLAIAGLLLYLDRKNHSAEVATAPTGTAQAAPAIPSAGAPAKSDETGSSPPSAAPSETPAPPTAANATEKPLAGDPRQIAPSVAKPNDAPKAAATPPGAPPAHPGDPPAAAVQAHADIPAIDNPPSDKPMPAAPNAALPDPPAGRAARPTVERIPPRVVDVESHLTDPLPAINYREVPLVEFLAELSQWSTIPITLDMDALNELSISPAVPLSLHVKDTTVAGVLDEALGPLGLTYTVVNRQLLVGRPRQGQFRRVRYGVSDLSGDTAEGMSQFAALLRSMVDPNGWKESGGTGTSQWTDGVLLVEQCESAHAQLLVFCEKLRIARGLPLRSKIDPARFRLDPRTEAAKPALSQTVTANYGRPEPLARVLAYLHGTTKVNLLVDQLALADQRMSIETEGLLTADHQPLDQALTALLEPMDLTWRVVGERAIEITTPQAAARHADVEFYPVRELLNGETSGEALVARIQRELAAGTTSDLPAARPTIQFDAAGRCLIIRAPQSVQLRVASLLSGWRVARQ